MADIESCTRRPLALSAGGEAAAALGGPVTIRGDLFLPATRPDLLMVCVAGGGMNRQYFDLPTPPGEAEASFARAMVAQGFAVAMLDFLGIGESDEPADPFQLTPDVHAMALAAATGTLLDSLRAEIHPTLRSIGVGHSFGAGLNLAVQGRAPLHAGLALFGFGVAPLARLTMHAETDLPIEEARAGFAELARRRFEKPYLNIDPMGGPRGAMLAIANDRLLATSAFATVLPFTFIRDAEKVTAPLLIALGDKDLHGAPHLTVQYYPNSPDVTLLMLPETRHNHFVYPSRTGLFDRVATWARGL